MPQGTYRFTDVEESTPLGAFSLADAQDDAPPTSKAKGERVSGDSFADKIRNASGILGGVVGAAKGLGRSAAEIAQMAVSASPLGMTDTVWGTDFTGQANQEIERVKPQYANTDQRIGGAIETAAELANPVRAGVKGAVALAKGAPTAVKHVAKAGPVLFDVATGNYGRAARRLLGAALEKGANVADEIPKVIDDLQPQLPAGYTPRTSAPKAKPVTKAAPKAEPAPSDAPPKRAYFLKSPEDIAAARATPETVTPTGSITLDDLPAAWRQHTGQDIFPTTGVAAKEIRAAVMQEITDRGLSVGQALTMVSKNKDIPTAMRSQLIRAITTAKKGS